VGKLAVCCCCFLLKLVRDFGGLPPFIVSDWHVLDVLSFYIVEYFYICTNMFYLYIYIIPYKDSTLLCVYKLQEALI